MYDRDRTAGIGGDPVSRVGFQPGGDGKMSKKRVVLIDDSKLARFALTKQLKDQGLKVEAFESAEQGLAYLETEPADAVFMDHLMPGMDGLEATRAIRGNPDTANIPVVLCTSNDTEEHSGPAPSTCFPSPSTRHG
jgi:CheY-like chemotaxis protein